MRKHLAWLAPLAVAACGAGDNDPGPGGVTMSEARALNEAARMLEERPVPPEALRPVQPPVPAAQPDKAAQ